MSDPSTDAARDADAAVLERVTAVLTAAVARFAGVPVAGSDAGQVGPCLSRSPYFPIGYALSSELLAFAAPDDDLAPAGGPDRGLDTGDVFASQTAAFVFDKLVNPVLPAAPTAPFADATTALNEIYAEILRRARFAGTVAPTAARAAAEAILYETGPDGTRTPTDSYEAYLAAAAQVRAAQERLDALDVESSEPERSAAQADVDRLLADWATVGHQREVDAAIAVIVNDDSGFEDDRRELLTRLRSGERLRLDAPGLSYFVSRLVPLDPLLADDVDRGWTAIDVDAAEIASLLTRSGHPATANDAVALLQRVTFRVLRCDVTREWFDPGFFAERFWRLGTGEQVADGNGDGLLGGYASALLFVREAARHRRRHTDRHVPRTWCEPEDAPADRPRRD